MAERDYILEMRNITKSFYGVKALDGVELLVERGEVHALVGENGAGKSTLMNVLSGVFTADSGRIVIDGQEVQIRNPADARKLGIAIVHQEISLVNALSIADNMFLGVEPRKQKFFIDRKTMFKKAQEILDEFGLSISARDKVSTLSIAQQQMVEFAKAVFFDAKILILDEPSASLSDSEVAALFKQIRALKEKGVTFIYISHRLDEIYDLCDHVTIFRDSHYIDSKPVSEIEKSEMIRKMVGREINDMFGSYRRKRETGEVIFEARHLRNKYLKDISFELRKGEILGFAGLVGARRTELMRAIYGVDRLDEGEIYIHGKKVQIKSPRDAIRNKIVLCPEDRKNCGLVLMHSVAFNTTLTVIKEFIHGIHKDKKKEKEIIDTYTNKLRIKMSSPAQKCLYLSGGNQQKVVISKWMATDSEIIIFDEPTRGIDISAKAEIYALIHDMVDQGYSIMMVSSEMPEIINMCNRVVVLSDGVLEGTIDIQKEYPDSLDGLQERIMEYSLGEV